jgi:3-oxoacyl-[acyl-carrier protein] reductase
MKNILVVGAGNGIGLAIAQQHQESNNVIAISRSTNEAFNNLSADKYIMNIGAENIEGLQNLPEEIHGIVYCPGSINLRPFNRISIADFSKELEQNVLGAVNIIQFVLPKLKKANGASVVLFSTVAAKLGMPFHAGIATAKGAIEGLAKSLASELAGANIRVNVIAPSLTDTALAAPLLNTPEKQEAAAKRHPLQRVGTTNDMASLAKFLLSEDASWITGQVIGVDGGMGTTKS